LRYAQVAPAEADVSGAGSLAFEARGCRSGESRTEGTRRGGRCGVPGGHRDPPWPLARHRAGLRGPSVGRANRGYPRSRASGSCLPALPWVSRARRSDHCLAAPLEHAHHPPGITGVPLSTCLRASTPAATDHSAGLRPRVPARAARDAFRPRGFAPPRRFAPRTTPERVRCGSGFGPDKVAGVLQPATDWGSPRFDGGGLGPTDIAARRRDHTTASSRRVHTPRRFPRQQPDGVTTAVAPVTFHRSCGPRRTRTALARR